MIDSLKQTDENNMWINRIVSQQQYDALVQRNEVKIVEYNAEMLLVVSEPPTTSIS